MNSKDDRYLRVARHQDIHHDDIEFQLSILSKTDVNPRSCFVQCLHDLSKSSALFHHRATICSQRAICAAMLIPRGLNRKNPFELEETIQLDCHYSPFGHTFLPVGNVVPRSRVISNILARSIEQISVKNTSTTSRGPNVFCHHRLKT